MKQQLKNYILFIILIAVFVTPSLALAAWWNPFSWGFWNSLFHRQTPTTQNNQKLIGGDKDSHGCLIAAGYSWCKTKNKCLRIWEEKCEAVINAEVLKNITLSYPNPYDTSKNDSIKLVNGKAVLYDAGNIKPRGYNVATTAIGDLDGDGISDGVIGIYQSYGANIITPIIFVFSNKNGALTQTDSVLPDPSAWNYETQIKSLSIDNGILSVNLLVLAEKDQALPHYQQQATVAKTVQYKLINGKLVLQPTNQTAGWKTYTNTQYGFEIKYPDTWFVQQGAPGELSEGTPGAEQDIELIALSPVSWQEINHYEALNAGKGFSSPEFSQAFEREKNIIRIKVGNVPPKENCESNPPQTQRISIGNIVGCREEGYLNWTVIDVRLPLPNKKTSLLIHTIEANSYLDIFNKIISTFKFTK